MAGEEAATATTPPAEAPKQAPRGAAGKTITKPCPHCAQTLPVTHPQWCEKNPKRRVMGPRGKKPDAAPAAGKRKRDYARENELRAARKAKGGGSSSKQEAFLKGEREALQAKAADKPANTPPPADKPADKKKGGSGWALAIVAGLGLLWLLYLFFTAEDTGKPPRDRKPEVAETPPANAHMPGVGSFHVPGLRTINEG